MNIKINSVHFTADQRLVEFINKKIGKLDTFFEGIISCEITLRVEKPEAANNKVSEVKLSVPGNDYLFAKKQADTFEEGIDLAVEAVRRQLKKLKEKIREN